MRYRVSATKGHFVQGAEVPPPIDMGTFTITNRRAVFAGAKQTREWAWSKLISVTHASDLPWTAISVSNRQKTSGILYDTEHEDIVRFWLDLGIARGTDGTDALAHELEQTVDEIRATLTIAPDATARTVPPSSIGQPEVATQAAGLVAATGAGAPFAFVEGTDVRS